MTHSHVGPSYGRWGGGLWGGGRVNQTWGGQKSDHVQELLPFEALASGKPNGSRLHVRSPPGSETWFPFFKHRLLRVIGTFPPGEVMLKGVSMREVESALTLTPQPAGKWQAAGICGLQLVTRLACLQAFLGYMFDAPSVDSTKRTLLALFVFSRPAAAKQ